VRRDAVILPAALVQAVRSCEPGGVAAFDADGTLWREDVGEAFLRHLVAIGWVRLPDGRDPYAEYERRVDRDKRAGYAFAAQLQEGILVEKLEEEADRFAREWVPPRLVASAQELRAACEKQGLRTVVVSASPLPIVLAAAPLAGFAKDDCLGIEVQVSDGRFTDQVIEPVTYGDGKVEALRRQRLLPLSLACGDSFAGDLALLRAARVPVVVAPLRGSPLADEARRNGWAVLGQE
jgi:phosphatidylglycerophosphatase C